MDYRVLANAYASEGTLAGVPVTPSLPWRPRRIMFTNDSSINTMTVAFGGATLSILPLETLTTSLTVSAITFDGTGPYRFWAFG